MTNDPAASRGALARSLAHPASLLLLTAVLTGLLVPWITNRWEVRDRRVEAQRVAIERRAEERRAAAERELEVKSAIVSRISTASGRFLSAIEVGLIGPGQGQARSEYRAFKNAALEVAAQLAAYFPRSQPLARWRDQTSGLRDAYLLLTAPPGRARSHWLHRLNRHLDQAPTQLNGLCFRSTNPSFATALRILVVALQNKEEEVVRTVVAGPSVLTGTPLRPVRFRRKHYDATKPRPCG